MNGRSVKRSQNECQNHLVGQLGGQLAESALVACSTSANKVHRKAEMPNCKVNTQAGQKLSSTRTQMV